MAEVMPAGYTPSVVSDNRDELIAALHQLTAFTEGLLTHSEGLLRAYDTEARRTPRSSPPCVRESCARREQLEGFKQRLAGTTTLGDRPLPLQ
jgi:hypothetical protein